MDTFEKMVLFYNFRAINKMRSSDSVTIESNYNTKHTSKTFFR